MTKVAGELFGAVYNSLYGMEVVSLRVTEVYGPGLWMPSLLGDMIRAGLRGEVFRLEAGGDHPFQFVYVEDVATAARLASTAARWRRRSTTSRAAAASPSPKPPDCSKSCCPEAHYDIGPGLLPQWDHQGAYDLSASSATSATPRRGHSSAASTAQIDWIRSTERRRH